jgi:hypothetical protein
MLKPPGTKHLKLKDDVPLSNVAFNFNLRRHVMAIDASTLIDKAAMQLSVKGHGLPQTLLAMS